MSMASTPVIWNKIIGLTDGEKMFQDRPVYVTKGQGGSLRWLIGRHRDLKEILPKLRGPAASVDDVANDLIYGRREIDLLPDQLTRTHKSYRSLIDEDKPAPMSKAEYQGILKRNNGEGLKLPKNRQKAWVAKQPRRRREMFPAAALFFEDASLESHHIFEKFLVNEFGKLAGELSINEAPCVAASKEIHSRYFTPDVAGDRYQISNLDDARTTYKRLYKAPEFGDLLKISLLVIDEVGRP
jgi:hypothetical protein